MISQAVRSNLVVLPGVAIIKLANILRRQLSA